MTQNVRDTLPAGPWSPGYWTRWFGYRRTSEAPISGVRCRSTPPPPMDAGALPTLPCQPPPCSGPPGAAKPVPGPEPLIRVASLPQPEAAELALLELREADLIAAALAKRAPLLHMVAALLSLSQPGSGSPDPSSRR